jgi:hypothetical protein
MYYKLDKTKMKIIKFTLILFVAFSLLIITSCKKKAGPINDVNVLHANEEELTKVIIYDVFTPPVASRIYGYCNLASYECQRYSDAKYASILPQIKGFGKAPVPVKGKTYNYTLAATKAFFIIAHKVTFSVDSLQAYEDDIYGKYKASLDSDVYNRSMAFGDTMGKLILKRAMKDNYPQTRGKPKYLGNNGHAQWRPTAPDYFDGVEYCWGTMKPFLINSSDQFPIPAPAPYSTDTNSVYMQQQYGVYRTSQHLTKVQLQIARFWDDNPFVVQHDGHMMFADKKITPGGHWIGITSIACKQTNCNAIKTAQAYMLTSIALFDSFICSWEAKYQYSYIRPVSAINEDIDHAWQPLLQTPPFPECPAGHADISAASSTVLTHLFGDHFAFMDTTENRYVGIQRHFDSFITASDETALSRFYGGIHYLSSVQKGAVQGHQIGNFILGKIKLYN